MLPLALANLVVVAVLEELQHPAVFEGLFGLDIETALGAWKTPLMVVATWVLTLGTYLLAVAIIPLHSDNRPVLKREETDLDTLAR